MRSVIRPGLILSALALGLLVTFSVPARADFIPSAPATPTPAAADAVPLLAQLQSAGLTAEQAADRVGEMTPADLAVLAENPEQIQCAGDIGTIALIAGAVILVAVILYLIVNDKL